MIIDKIFDKVLSKFNTTSDDTNKINKKLDKNKSISIDSLSSKRYFGKGSDGHYVDEDATRTLDEYGGEVSASLKSTAIDKVDYDPKTQVCNVKYVDNPKWYRFENMSPQQFKSFMAASSKGRYVQKVMRVKNRAKGY